MNELQINRKNLHFRPGNPFLTKASPTNSFGGGFHFIHPAEGSVELLAFESFLFEASISVEVGFRVSCLCLADVVSTGLVALPNTASVLF